jgi:hypothetical protein
MFEAHGFLTRHWPKLVLLLVALVLPQLTWFLITSLSDQRWATMNPNLFGYPPVNPYTTLLWGVHGLILAGVIFYAAGTTRYLTASLTNLRGGRVASRMFSMVTGTILAIAVPITAFFLVESFHRIGTRSDYETMYKLPEVSFGHTLDSTAGYWLNDFSFVASFILVGVAVALIGIFLSPRLFAAPKNTPKTFTRNELEESLQRRGLSSANIEDILKVWDDEPLGMVRLALMAIPQSDQVAS